MTEDDLKKRTKQFALRVLKLVAALPRTIAGRTIGNQLARSGTSVWLRTIEPLVAPDLKQNSFRDSALLKKKRTRVRFGSS